MLERPDSVPGVTLRYETACGELSVTVTKLNSKPFEVFIRGTFDSCNKAHMEAIGRLISWGLRSGAPMEGCIKHLNGIGCGSIRFNSKEGTVLSCADAVAKALRAFQETYSKEI